MNRNHLTASLVLALTTAGCTTHHVGIYDECVGDVFRCPAGSTVCEYVAVDWGGPYGVSQGSICTGGCFSDADCPISHNGELGFCAKVGMVGNPDQACVERCIGDFDCAGGYTCVGSGELSTLPFGVRICVPGQSAFAGGQLLYGTCGNLNDCNSNATVCQYSAIAWPSGTVAGSICTVPCASDAGCAPGTNGFPGYCAPVGVFGNDVAACFERCTAASDCDPGFVCADNADYGSVAYGAGVCIPGSGKDVAAAQPYQPCYQASDCGGGLGLCSTLAATWADLGYTSYGSICTVGCGGGCPTSANGLPGVCAPAGSVNATAVCVESCTAHSDCAYGFACADAKEIPSLPPGTAICVPR